VSKFNPCATRGQVGNLSTHGPGTVGAQSGQSSECAPSVPGLCVDRLPTCPIGGVESWRDYGSVQDNAVSEFV
jgi:hypothetical protein